jgi:hypothetical protein
MRMSKHSTHSRQKGCALCKPHKFKDLGQAQRKPRAELKAIGKGRRVSRHDLGDAV